jgi:hypothetical protein
MRTAHANGVVGHTLTAANPGLALTPAMRASGGNFIGGCIRRLSAFIAQLTGAMRSKLANLSLSLSIYIYIYIHIYIHIHIHIHIHIVIYITLYIDIYLYSVDYRDLQQYK